jgi:hypothetical protein
MVPMVLAVFDASRARRRRRSRRRKPTSTPTAKIGIATSTIRSRRERLLGEAAYAYDLRRISATGVPFT